MGSHFTLITKIPDDILLKENASRITLHRTDI